MSNEDTALIQEAARAAKEIILKVNQEKPELAKVLAELMKRGAIQFDVRISDILGGTPETTLHGITAEGERVIGSIKLHRRKPQ
jgi:hypothetical protein